MAVPHVLALCLASATFYAGAAAVMKLAGGTPFLLLAVPLCAALGLAAWFESLALPGNRLGIVVLLIIGSEVLITAGVCLVLGERYSFREVAGLLIIFGGILLVFGGGEAGAEAPNGDCVVAPASDDVAQAGGRVGLRSWESSLWVRTLTDDAAVLGSGEARVRDQAPLAEDHLVDRTIDLCRG
jgi:hypothetical protein